MAPMIPLKTAMRRLPWLTPPRRSGLAITSAARVLPLLVLFGCGDPASLPGNAIASITISPAEPSVSYGKTLQVSATVRAEDGSILTDRAVTWSTSDVHVARIDPSGLVTGVSPGSVVITATVDRVTGSAPGVVEPLRFVSVEARLHRTCGITADGDAYCWGNGEFGQLGNGTQDTIPVPVLVSGGFSFTILATGSVSCGLSGGYAYCWGGGPALGNGGASVMQTAPGPVSGDLPFATISGGYGHMCGLVGSEAYCWGRNDFGQLGSPGAERCDGPYCSTTPVPVVGDLSFNALSAGGAHTCGLTSTGAAYCWGYDGSGALGDGASEPRCNGDFECSPEPLAVAGDLEFSAIDTGIEHTCGLATDGVAYCWGWGAEGQLGTGDTADRAEPAQVAGGLTFASISAGRDHTCAIAMDGTAHCWGRGYLSDGSFVKQLTPAPAGGGLLYRAIAAGWRSSCGIATDERLYCWGVNLFGELGDGTMTDRPLPAAVWGQ